VCGVPPKPQRGCLFIETTPVKHILLFFSGAAILGLNLFDRIGGKVRNPRTIHTAPLKNKKSMYDNARFYKQATPPGVWTMPQSAPNTRILFH